MEQYCGIQGILADKENLCYDHSYTTNLENLFPAGKNSDVGLLFPQKLRLKTEEENRIHIEIETFLKKEQQVSHQNLFIRCNVSVPLIKHQRQQKEILKETSTFNSASLMNEL